MTDEKREIIKNGIQDALELRQEYLSFEMQMRTQLQLAQFAYFQTVSSIGIGVVAISFARSSVTVPLLTTVSGIAFITLILYVNSYIREVVDAVDGSLPGTRRMVWSATQKQIDKGIAAIKHNNEDVFFTADGEIKKDPNLKKLRAPTNYAGEIANFLFALGVFSGIGIFTINVTGMPEWYLLIIILMLSGVSSFFNWSRTLTDVSSLYLGKIEAWFKAL